MLMHIFLYIVCLLCNTITTQIKGDTEFEGAGILEVEHAVVRDGAATVFEPKGTIAIRSVKNLMASYHAKMNVVTDEFIKKLKESAEEGGIYRVRVPTRLSSMSVNSATGLNDSYVYGWTSACSLLESNLSDDLHIHINADDHVVSVSVFTSSPVAASKPRHSPGSGAAEGSGHTASQHAAGTAADHHPATCRHVPIPLADEFNTTLQLSGTVAGPQPETNAYLEKLEKERIEREKGDGSDKRSFIAKYWMYIVPVVIFMLISNAANTDAGGGGGGR